MNGPLIVGVSATKASWSGELRGYLRDHTQGVTVHVVMDRAHLSRLSESLDVMVVDDVMRLFSAADIDGLCARGTTVLGVHDRSAGQGPEYLRSLGATLVVDADNPFEELVSALGEAEHRQPAAAGVTVASIGPRRSPAGNEAAGPGHGVLSVWTKATGGCGLTEAVVGAAEHLSASRRVLLVELEDVAPVLAARLLRSPDSGLEWALSRAAQGRDAVPDGLSGARGDGFAPVGHFDAICSGQGHGQLPAWSQLERLLDQLERHYDQVLVEAPAFSGRGERDRAMVWRSLLDRAANVVVLVNADPESAGRLVDWRATWAPGPLGAPCWAVFGRFGGNRQQRAQLAELVATNTVAAPFAGLAFLPEDAVVQRARWRATLAGRGQWHKALRAVVEGTVP